MKHALLLICLFLSALLFAQAPILAYRSLGVSADDPVGLVSDGVNPERLYVVERDGRIRILDLTTNSFLSGDYLNITGLTRCCGERGLLGLAFDPDFATNGHFYVNYTKSAEVSGDDATTVIARYTAPSSSATSVPTGSAAVLLKVGQPFSNHNAGDLAFGPDGFLYIPLGDGGSGNDPGNRSQNTGLLLGKMLRIDVNGTGSGNYGIPADNPFVGNSTIPDEIYQIGLRNPWRISFDAGTGDLYIADVGQNAWEEVNYVAAGCGGGQNFGWKPCEGDHPRGDQSSTPCGNGSFTDPVFEYNHNSNGGRASITGGYVYRGTALPALQGYYVGADYISDRAFLFRVDGSGAATNVAFQDFADSNTSGLSSVSTFGTDMMGNLYLASLGDDGIYEVVTERSLPVTLREWTAAAAGKTVDLRWTTDREENALDFDVERSADGRGWQLAGTVDAAGNSTTPRQYALTDERALTGRSFYRLRQRDRDGTETLSDLREVLVFGPGAVPIVYPNPARGELNVALPTVPEGGVVHFELVGPDGRRVLNRSLPAAARMQFDLPEVPGGTYRLLIAYDREEFVVGVVLR